MFYITAFHTGCIKKIALGKYSLNQRARKISENFQLPKEVEHPLVHPALKLFIILSFSEQEMRY